MVGSIKFTKPTIVEGKGKEGKGKWGGGASFTPRSTCKSSNTHNTYSE